MNIEWNKSTHCFNLGVVFCNTIMFLYVSIFSSWFFFRDLWLWLEFKGACFFMGFGNVYKKRKVIGVFFCHIWPWLESKVAKKELWDLTMSRRREEEVAHIFSWELVMVRKKRRKVVTFLKKFFFWRFDDSQRREEEAQIFFYRMQQWLKEENKNYKLFFGIQQWLKEEKNRFQIFLLCKPSRQQ